MASYHLLPAQEEEEIFKIRLLNVEEKPFKRISKRLASLHTLTSARARQLATPPPDAANQGAGEAAAAADELPDLLRSPEELSKFREDVMLDFAAMESAITRFQFLLSSNERERARYNDDKVRIMDECDRVRDRTGQLRAQLDEARATLEQRKKFDELAGQITKDPKLRPRNVQEAALRKLQEECAQLEEESGTYVETARERKEQFSRIMDESMRLRRLIRDEKEEVERREGMDDEGEAGGAEAENEGATPRPGISSGNATPKPDSGALPKLVPGLDAADASTPRPSSTLGGQTPARETPGPDESLKDPQQGESFSRESRAPSAAPSTRVVDAGETPKEAEGTDVDMEDSSRAIGTPQQAADTPRITVEGDEAGEKMDTT
ncbi:uncharacterized protein E0L32_011638 [Thyridium curvatum]|uniref:Tho complex subunit 7 n=1 Tax=Thyridium curvatum TaxID=1093900 RepID=A0A507BG32_9PEZI|nr:uncharacterized protein E0L32_011638 [Thyridium curvatum]TPX18453.1 hypothetical protein E0L32_011638 [Thyridium curvatum]